MRLLSITASVVILVIALFVSLPVSAQPDSLGVPMSEPAGASPDVAGMQDKLVGQMEQINAQYRILLQQMQAVEEQRRELELMMSKVAELDEYRGGTDTSDAAPAAVGEEQRKELEATKDKIPELPRVSSDVGGVLTPRGKLVVEPSVQFLNNSVTRVALEGLGIFDAIQIGSIDVRSVERESFVAALTGRYGITNRLEAELKASYVWRDDSTVTRPVLAQSSADKVFNASGSDIGDVEAGLRYQFKKRQNWPFLVGNLRIKSDTGTDPFEIQTKDLLASGATDFSGELATGSGFWSINPSITFIIPSDPVAIFGNVGYLWTIEDDKGIFVRDDPQNPGQTTTVGFGKVDPGDAIRFNFGMGIGLNEMSSISFSYALDLFSETEIEASKPKKIVGSDVTIGKFLLGYSFRVGRNGTPINLAVGIGTTDAAPDTDITLRVPFTVVD